jgi:high-affinity nickel permease
MDFEFLFGPVEGVDAWLAGLFAGAPFAVALGVSLALGLRHASDPDHLVAVTSLLASDGGDTRAAMRLGAWWGAGHALTLLAIGLPLIVLESQLPGWLEHGAEIGVGIVIVVLAVRVCWTWMRGDPDGSSSEREVRSSHQAFGIGLLHGLAGTGAVVLLLIAALPSTTEAATALAVFAPMSVVSMAGLSGAWAWVLTRPAIEPVYRTALLPALGIAGLLFGLWYAGIG